MCHFEGGLIHFEGGADRFFERGLRPPSKNRGGAFAPTAPTVPPPMISHVSELTQRTTYRSTPNSRPYGLSRRDMGRFGTVGLQTVKTCYQQQRTLSHLLTFICFIRQFTITKSQKTARSAHWLILYARNSYIIICIFVWGGWTLKWRGARQINEVIGGVIINPSDKNRPVGSRGVSNCGPPQPPRKFPPCWPGYTKICKVIIEINDLIEGNVPKNHLKVS